MAQKSLLGFFSKTGTVNSTLPKQTTERVSVTPTTESKEISVDELRQQFVAEVETIDIEARARAAESENRLVVEWLPSKRRRSAALGQIGDDDPRLQIDEEDQPGDNDDDDDDGDDDDNDTLEKSKKARTNSTTKMTPLEQQYVALRDANPGVVLAIETGYKYLFFDEDSLLANELLRLVTFTKSHGNIATSSVPVNRVMYHIRRLCIAGLKVARVRQVETAALKKASGKRGAFARAVDTIYTRATFVGADDIDPLEARDDDMTTGGYLLCVCERAARKRASSAADDVDTRSTPTSEAISILALNAATGEIVFDEFDDDALRSGLDARLSLLEPREILFACESLSVATRAVIAHYSNVKVDRLVGVSKTVQNGRARLESLPATFFDASDALGVLERAFDAKSGRRDKKSKDNDDGGDDDTEELPVPATLTDLQRLRSKPRLDLACVSALYQHLTRLRHLAPLLLVVDNYRDFTEAATMRLDAGAVRMLSLFATETATTRGTLFAHINRCRTAMGSRLLKRWLAAPLLSATQIESRLDAVALLRPNTDRVACLQPLVKFFTSMPDLERGLARIYHQNCSPAEFVKILSAFEKGASLYPPKAVASAQFGGSSVLMSLLDGSASEGGSDRLTVVRERVSSLLSALDRAAAATGDVLRLFSPTCVLYPEINTLTREMTALMHTMESVHLPAMRARIGIASLTFVAVSGNEYLVEVPVSSKSRVPSDWKLVMSTTKVSRYRSAAVVTTLEALQRVRERLQLASQSAWLNYLTRTLTDYGPLRAFVISLATLDALLGLAEVSALPNYCRPTILDYTSTDEGPMIDAIASRHPVIETLVDNAYVPSDISLGDASDDADQRRRVLLITGANCGGKSSYLRHVAVQAILAQIGSFVPASSLRLRPFDAVFVRMGAADALAHGQSTFFVELHETAALLKGATRRSLLILDELGRGTSTVDGTAIAFATLQYICQTLRSACLFVTHYPTLGQLVDLHPSLVAAFHMAYREEEAQRITFLFRLQRGIAPTSFGINVARMAGLPQTILNVAATKSAELEQQQILAEFLKLLANCE